MAYSISGVFGSWANLVKNYYAKSLKVGVLAYVLPIIILSALLYLVAPNAFGLEVQELTMQENFWSGVMQVLAMLCGLLYSAYCFVLMAGSKEKDLSSTTLSVALKFLLLSIGVFFVYFVAVLLIVGLVLTKIWWLVALVSLAVFIAVALLYVYLAVTPAVIAQGLSVWEAVKTSCSLVRRDVWKVIGTYLVLLMVCIALAVLLLILIVIGSLGVLLLASASSPLFIVVEILLAPLFGFVFMPLAAAFVTSVYRQLRE